MKRLVAAALTAVTTAIAGSAIALTPVYAQEVPPDPTAEPSATLAQIQAPASGSNIVVFVVPESMGEVTDAACSVDEVAEETSSKSMMRFGNHERSHPSATHEMSRGPRTSNDSDDSDDSVGLPSEACTTLRGLFASLAGLVPQAPLTDGATDVAIDDDEDSANDEDTDSTEAFETEDRAGPSDDDGTDTDEDGTDGLLTPTSRTSVYVTIFAGGDAAEDGCTLDELVAAANGAVPVVEAGGEIPLQGAADVSGIALPADVCALLSALFSTTGTAPTTPAVLDTDGDETPSDDATMTPDTDEADDADADADDADADEADADEADADDADAGTSTPAAGSATTTPSSNGTTTPSGNGTTTPSRNTTATPTGTATPTATGTPDADDEEEEADSGGNAP